jgi:hypothetical protein
VSVLLISSTLNFSPKYLRRVTNYENPKVKGGETCSTHPVKSDIQIECVQEREQTEGRGEGC